jgi:S-adenosylmethionine:tRNA ribosyltransferase-isomerase
MMSVDYHLDQFQYELPGERIAKYPLQERSASKLLYFKAGHIEHCKFRDLPKMLPKGSLLIFNESKVIPARIHLKTVLGKMVEVMLLHPVSPHKDPLLCLSFAGEQVWECMIGNRRAWKAEEVIVLPLDKDQELHFSWEDREANLIRLTPLTTGANMADLLQKIGELPLPPYLNRNAEELDKSRYQTVYANKAGSVAAPTAGLHFDEEILKQLLAAGHKTAKVTLHVGAGTFQPVKTSNMLEHPMHGEFFEVSAELLQTISTHNGPVIAVGTTSLRALESLPYLLDGTQLQLQVEQFPLKAHDLEYRTICQRLLAVMRSMQLKSVFAETKIMIHPGFEIKFASGIVTNFHQPGSTLLLLIASLIGDSWRQVYQEAMNNDYRFLSYGDSSLLLWK